MSTQPTEPTTDTEQNLADLAAGHLHLDGGFLAVEAVGADGERTFWLLDPDVEEDGPHPIPEHEMTGPLPPSVRVRLGWSPHPVCGRPTAAGEPCRIYATEGRACRWHKSVTA